MVTLTGTNFVAGATTVAVAGGGMTVTNVVVGSSTSLTASFVLDLAAAFGARTVTVTTAGGTSGAQTFTINLPVPGSTISTLQVLWCPFGTRRRDSILIVAVGAQGGGGVPVRPGGADAATCPSTPGGTLKCCRGPRRNEYGPGPRRRLQWRRRRRHGIPRRRRRRRVRDRRGGVPRPVVVAGGGGGGVPRAAAAAQEEAQRVPWRDRPLTGLAAGSGGTQSAAAPGASERLEPCQRPPGRGLRHRW